MAGGSVIVAAQDLAGAPKQECGSCLPLYRVSSARGGDARDKC